MPMENQFILWLAHLFESLHTNECLKFMVAIWAIWFHRNNKLHNNSQQEPIHIAQFVVQHLKEFQDSRPLPVLQPSTTPPPGSWSPPPENFVKANFDASFIPHGNRSGTGIVIRNSNGEIMVSCVHSNPGIPNATFAEALACEQAVLLSCDLSFRESLLKGTRSINFKSLSFSHVKRDLNLPAHILARMGTSSSHQLVWIEEAPSKVLEASNRDYRWVVPLV
ncbi:hypothetical protein V6N13_099158 [Hibiscus sabdariffa]